MECLVISSKEEKRWKNVESLVLPASSGEAEILPGYAESFIQLKPGVMILRNPKEETLSITKGICYVHNDKILIIT